MVRFLFNPFTDKLDIAGTGIGPAVETISGNSGGAVGPNAMFNIDLLGDNTTGLNVVGNPGTSTLTIFGIASSSTQIGTTRYATNAEAAAQTINNAALTPSNITSMFSVNPLPSSQGGTSLSSPAAHQLMVTNGSSPFTLLGVASNGQIPIGSIGSNPVLANITSTDGTIVITNGPGTIDLAAASGVSWSTITANQALAIEHGYICVSPGGALTLSLPPVSSVGNIIEVTLDGATSFSISQGASQSIRLGNNTTTVGVGGSLSSSQQGDSLRMVCSVANLKWNVVSSMGNLTVV